jgi:hypothetical protein
MSAEIVKGTIGTVAAFGGAGLFAWGVFEAIWGGATFFSSEATNAPSIIQSAFKKIIIGAVVTYGGTKLVESSY